MLKQRLRAIAWYCERQALRKASNMGDYKFYINHAVKSVHFRRGSVAAMDTSFFQDFGQKVPIGTFYNVWIVGPAKKNVDYHHFEQAKLEIQATCINSPSICESNPLRLGDQVTFELLSLSIHPTEPWVLAASYTGSVCIWNHQNQALFSESNYAL